MKSICNRVIMKKNSTPAPIPYLPNDIIVQILSRLPVESLIRFCCVCKFWRELVTSHTFIRYHLQQSSIHKSNRLRAKEIIYYCAGPCGSSRISCVEMQKFANANETSFFIETEKLVPVSCSSGVICFFQHCYCLSTSDICLWNPALHQFRILPDTNNSKGYHKIVMGFGLDHVNNDDKIVNIYQQLPVGSEKYKIEIYSLRNNSWKEINLSSVPFCIMNFAQDSSLVGVVYCGFLHWIAREIKENCFYLVAFDMAQENFRSISYPGNVFFRPHLGLFEGCLCVSGYTDGYIMFEIWVMKEYKVESSWIKQFILPQIWDISPLGHPNTTTIIGGGKILARQHDHVVIYDLESQKVEEHLLDERVWFRHDNCYFIVDNYAESLVSVGRSNDDRIFRVQLTSDKEKKEQQKFKSYLNKLFGCFVCRR